MIRQIFAKDSTMNLIIGARKVGARIAAVTISVMFLLTATAASAQESNSGELFEKEVLELLLESRIQKPADQATAQERASAIEELTNIYLVSNLPRAIELGNSPAIKAQLDLQDRAILFNAFANDFLANNQATDQEIFNMYEEQVALAPPKEFKARHILVESQGAATDLVEQLQAGADFVELAKEHSTGPSAPSGGDLGWFTAQAMVKPFSDAVAAMEDGEFTSAPVQTQFGWHVILREDSRDSAPPPLESVSDALKQRVAQQKFQDFMKSLRSNSSE
jgi:peptidyl-prolyl cis-trans isomerase C